MNVREASGLSAIGAIGVRGASGLSAIAVGAIRDADSLETFFQLGGGSFTVDVPFTAYGAAAFDAPVTITTETVTATVTGGRAPFNYSWARTDDALGLWSIVSPTSATTAFRRISVEAQESWLAEFACTVTDANGSIVTSANVQTYVTNYGGLGGPLP